MTVSGDGLVGHFRPGAVGDVVGPVPAGGVHPAGSSRRVEPDQISENRRREVGGEVEEDVGPQLDRADAELAQPVSLDPWDWLFQ